MNIQEQIKKHEEAIKKLKEKLEETEWLAIPELGIEISKPNKCKTFAEALGKLPKDCELPELTQLLYIWENEKYRNYFYYYLKEPFWHFFWCKQLWTDKKNDWSRMLCLDGDLDLGSNLGNLAVSDDDGRVAFVRPLKKSEVKK